MQIGSVDALGGAMLEQVKKFKYTGNTNGLA